MNPDWVITGMPHGNGVRIIASKNIKPGSAIAIVQAEEEAALRLKDGRRLRETLYSHDHYLVTVLAEDIVIADGRDYASALRVLFSIWQVPDAATPVTDELKGGRRGIEG